LFLIAAYKLLEYVDWAKQLAFLDTALFREIEGLRSDIKEMRDLNEHAIEYFMEKGRFPQKWLDISDAAITDASATIGDKIGNRLNWHEVGMVAKKLITALPPDMDIGD
jgi:hypothetical protein